METRWSALMPDVRNVTPLYLQLARNLATAIHCGVWSAGEALPSERSLSDAIGVSRITARKAIELMPGKPFLPAGLAIIQIQRGEIAAALDSAQQEPPGAWRDIALAIALQVGSDRAAADAALKDLIARSADGAAYQIAEAYGLRKDPDSMFTWLDRAWDIRDSGISRLLTDPFILPYADDPRFAAFCRKVGLPAPGPAAPTGSAGAS